MENKSENINELAKALCAAQAALRGAVKDSTNPFFKSQYADLQAVWDAIREPFTKNGLAISQTSTFLGDKPCLVTTLMHSSGQWIEGVLPIYPIKMEPQAIGSAITYARRYALAAIAGVYQIDDDGEAHRTMGTSSGVAHNSTTPVKMGAPATKEAANSPYKVNFGKHKGKYLSDMSIDEIRGYCKYLEDSAKNEGKPVSKDAVHFLSEAKEYLAKWSKSSAPTYTPRDTDPSDDIPF